MNLPWGSSGHGVFLSTPKEPYQAIAGFFLFSLSLNFLPSSPNSFYEIKISNFLFDCATLMLRNFHWLRKYLWNKIQTLSLGTEVGPWLWHHLCLKPSPKSLWNEPKWYRHIVLTVPRTYASLLHIILCHSPKLEWLFPRLLKSFKYRVNSQVLYSAIPHHNIHKRSLLPPPLHPTPATPRSMQDLSSWPGINPCPLQWKHRVLTTGPPGNSQDLLFLRTGVSLCWNDSYYLVIVEKCCLFYFLKEHMYNWVKFCEAIHTYIFVCLFLWEDFKLRIQFL